MNKAIIITITLITLLIGIVSAEDFQQYLPSPTANDIVKVRTSELYAMAITNNTNYLLYNGTEWAEINAPVGEARTLMGMDKASNKKFYFYFLEGLNNYSIWEYNPTGTFVCPACWSQNETGIDTKYNLSNNDYDYDGFACIKQGNGYTGNSNDAECYIARSNNTGANLMGALGVVNGVSITANETIASKLSPAFTVVYANIRLYLFARRHNQFGTNVFEYNGVSWVNRGLAGLNPFAIEEQSSTRKITTTETISGGSTDEGAYYYNSTTALFSYGMGKESFFDNRVPRQVSSGLTWRIYYTMEDDDIRSSQYGNNETRLELNSTQDLNSIDFDTTTGRGWCVGDNGVIYEYVGSGIGASSSLTVSMENNPVVYGTDTNAYATPSYSSGENSNVTMRFHNSTGDLIYSFTFLTAPSGIRGENLIDDIAWLSFPTGENITVNATSISLTTFQTLSSNIYTWEIITSATINVTNYNITEYKTNFTGYYNIRGVDTFGNDITFAIAENLTDLVLMSIDHSNLNNLVTDFYSIASSTAYLDALTSIRVTDNTTYVGTDDELYIYKGSENGVAGDLVLNDTISMTGRDYVTDVTEINESLAWICQKGYLTDNARMYNSTNNDLTESLGENPCESILYDSDTDLLYIHKGDSTFQIYNQTNRSLVGSITDVLNQPNNILHDRMSVSGDILYIVTASNTVTKYNVSTPSTPVKIDECRADRDITSIEAISTEEVIIGATNQIKICDFNNTETYQTTPDYYTAQTLISLASGETPLDIVLNKQTSTYSKMTVALGTNIGILIYYKAITEELTNTPPIISDIEISDTTPCLNGVIEIEVTAIDNEDEYLTYDWGCDALDKPNMENNYLFDSFECSYSTLGFHTIIVFASDGVNPPVSDTRTVTVVNETCQNQMLLKLVNYYNRSEEISGVEVTVDNQTGTTNTNGNVDFNLTIAGEHTITTTKDGWFPLTDNIYTSPYRQTVQIKSLTDTTGATITALTVITQNETGSRVNGTLVSVTNTLTGENKYGFTDSNGQVILTEMFTGTKLLLTAENQEQDYLPVSIYVNLFEGEQRTVTLNLGRPEVEGKFRVTGRGCSDMIEGILLCGNLSVTGRGNNCTTDADCITDNCRVGIDLVNGECSRFNWSICDRDGMGRGQGCFLKHTTYGGLSALWDTTLKYFALVLLVILIIALYVIIRRRQDER